jgi:hypothetical protein
VAAGANGESETALEPTLESASNGLTAVLSLLVSLPVKIIPLACLTVLWERGPEEQSVYANDFSASNAFEMETFQSFPVGKSDLEIDVSMSSAPDGKFRVVLSVGLCNPQKLLQKSEFSPGPPDPSWYLKEGTDHVVF